MPALDIQKIFTALAADNQDVLRGYSHLQAVRELRDEAARYARNRKKNPDWQKFASILSRAYHLLDVKDAKEEDELAKELNISHPLFIRDFSLGVARPSPERAARICERLADCLMVKEADVFAETARICAGIKRQKTAKL